MEVIILYFSLILSLGIFAQWIAWRIKIPAIIPLLLAGFLVGPVFGILDSRALLGDLFLPFVEILVPIIVFEGALGLKFQDIKATGKTIFLLTSIGVLVSFGILSAASYYILDFSLSLSCMFGALMVITGPTVILPILRQIRIKNNLASIIRWEGILIEPVGALLVTLVYQIMFTESLTAMTLSILIAKTVFGGLAIGIGLTYLILFLFDKHYLPDYLQEVFVLTVVVTAFVLANVMQGGAGLVTVVILGVLLANQRKISVSHIIVFKENIRILAISSLFVIIASSLSLETLKAYSGVSVFLFLLVVIFVSRPISVFVSTIGTSLEFKEKLFLSWIAPRGIITAAIASLFAVEMMAHGIQEAEALVPLTFFVIVVTVAVYGLSASSVQKLLRLQRGSQGYILLVGANEIARHLAVVLMSFGIKVMVIDTNKQNVEKAKFEGICAYHRNIFSFHLMEEVQSLGVDTFISLTNSDEVNLLSAMKYISFLGHESVYRIQSSTKESIEDKNINSIRNGNILFNDTYNFSKLDLAFKESKAFKTVKIEEEDQLNQLIDNKNEPVDILFVLKETKRLHIYKNNKVLSPKVGDTVIYLG